MICEKCREAADNKTAHPENCECTCQHKPSGSWNGGASE